MVPRREGDLHRGVRMHGGEWNATHRTSPTYIYMFSGRFVYGSQYLHRDSHSSRNAKLRVIQTGGGDLLEIRNSLDSYGIH